jgi:hypothetical protein
MSATGAAPSGQGIPLESIRGLRLFESRDEKLLLAHQLEVVLDRFYVHLPLKERMLGVRPVEQARLLQEHLARYPEDRSFMEALLGLSTGLRDFHMMLDLPEPWSRFTALLPFQLHEYFDASGVVRFLVGRLAPGVDLGGDFVPGVEVTHWNGEPLAGKLHRLGMTTAGANPPARWRRALEALTWRVLKYELPPEEDVVVLTYLGKKGPAQLELPWLVREAGALPEVWPGSRRFRALGRDSRFPDSLSSRSVETPSGTVGSLRIAHFLVSDVEGFVREVERLLRTLPEAGLIIDVRGNPGGSIPAAERLLQFFSSGRIEPASFSLRCTDSTREFCESTEEWSRWRPSLRQGSGSGEPYSQGFPLTPVEAANGAGWRYPGPVVLLCDALSYSATELFIAGFKDHHLGKIIGIDSHTGGGGSRMSWHHQLVRDLGGAPGSPLRPLPRGAEIRFALLRSTRAGAKRGVPLEGEGVEVDVLYRSTRDDVLHGDVDLLNRAAAVLTERA